VLKKFLPVLIAASLLLGAIGATSGVAFANDIKVPRGTDKPNGVAFGMQGFWSINPNFKHDVKVRRFFGPSLGVSGVKFIRPILILALDKDNKGGQLRGPAYVYSYLTPAEAKNINNLAFYFRNNGTGLWSALPTQLNKGPKGDRAVAEVEGFGWYVLGMK